MDLKLILEFAVLLGALLMGARAGGVGLGLWGAVGLLVLVIVFGIPPGTIPGEVILIVLTVIMAASAMEVAGGVDFLVRVAERIIRKNPKQVTIVAPLVTYAFTFASGTGHIVYPLLPVIYEVAHESGIRPERPMAIATIASQQAITASPVSAATAAMIGLLATHHIGLVQILMICVPSTLLAVVAAAFVQLRVGKELKDDPEYQRRLQAGEVTAPAHGAEGGGATGAAARPELKRGAKASACIFFAGVGLVVLAGIFPALRTVPGKSAEPIVVGMPVAIAIVMLAVAAVILTLSRAPVAEVPKCKTCQSGVTAIIGILGLAWLGDTFISANHDVIIGGLSSMAKAAPWTFAIGLFLASMLLYSQAATARALMPLGLSLGIPPASLVGMFPAVNGYFFIPNYGTLIAAMQFDRSGTTRIGRYLLNHSFMLPGLITTVGGVGLGLVIAKLFVDPAAMKLDSNTIADAAGRIGIQPEELSAVLERGTAVTYQAGDYLFHESSPREWMGLILEGDVDLVRGQHGKSVLIGAAEPGAILSEGVMLDDSAHATSAVTRQGAKVWQLPRAELDRVRAENPKVFYRLVGQVARRLSDRLRAASERLAQERGPATLSNVRREHDSLGEREVPNHAYYGIQTLRAVENFPFSGIHVRHYEHFVRALACVKKAAALANAELGVLDGPIAGAIGKACDELLAGRLHDQFVVDMIQGGAGTSTNMCANEVIANRALEFLGKAKGDYQFCHPNDHVNCSQSTNDAYPTAIKLGVWFTLRDTLSGLRELKRALEAKAGEFADVIKMGRTENQDAVPMTLGQEFSAYAVMIGDGLRHLEHAGNELLETNMGATAIGTGLNSPSGYAPLCTKKLAEVSGAPVRLAENLVEATQDSGEFALMSGAMRNAAVQLSKICNDLRWLSSGPRCGLYEIRLPAMQPGSSIMPGKVNPVVPEVVSQICFQIIGNDVTVAMASEASELELNMAEPIIAFNLFFGLTLLRNAAIVLSSRCIAGIEPNRERCREYVQNSIGLVTALNPVLGYEKSAAIAKEALKTGGSVYDLVIAKGWLTKEKLDELLKPENMTHPRLTR